jgi:hypothetical protein
MMKKGRSFRLTVLLCCAFVLLDRPTDRTEFPSLSTKVDKAIALAGGYLERACTPNGRFIYKVDTRTGREATSYNVVRHAGAIYAMAMLYHSRPDPQLRGALIRAATFLLHNYVRPIGKLDMLAVWPTEAPEDTILDLGATGLGLVALASVRQIDPQSVELEQLRSLGRFALFLQREDGSFISQYQAGTGSATGWDSFYYPGETALGLVALYDVDHQSEWLNAATKALSYLARNPTSLSAGPSDHWTLIATAAVLGRCNLNECQHSRQLLLQHAVRICTAIFTEGLIDWSGPRFIGQKSRTTAVATRMEGLLSALEFIPQTEVALRKQIRENIELGLRLLLRSQIAVGPYAGGIPRSFPGPPDESAVRIDYVQHALCVWIQYRKLFGAARAMCCRAL